MTDEEKAMVLDLKKEISDLIASVSREKRLFAKVWADRKNISQTLACAEEALATCSRHSSPAAMKYFADKEKTLPSLSLRMES